MTDAETIRFTYPVPPGSDLSGPRWRTGAPLAFAKKRFATVRTVEARTTDDGIELDVTAVVDVPFKLVGS